MFFYRVRNVARLDRIVVNECYMVLDALENIPAAFFSHTTPEGAFRQAFLQLGEVIAGTSVQRIFFTATLPPRDEMVFYKAAQLAPATVQLFRQLTTRPNLEYCVRLYTPDEKIVTFVVHEMARQRKQHSPRARILVYGGFVQRVKTLARALDCPIYYSGIRSESAKSDIFQRWLQTSDVMVATNALGAGIDISDIRATIYAVAPRRMRDYAQESGRSRRDSKPSTSVVFYMQEASHLGHKEDDRSNCGRRSRGKLLPGVIMPLEPGVAPVRVEISSRLKKKKRRPMPQDRPKLGPAVDVDMQQFFEGLRCQARPIPVPIPVPVPSHDHENDNYSDLNTEAILAAWDETQLTIRSNVLQQKENGKQAKAQKTKSAINLYAQ
ncbi:P-loop containing nucleoside triphosphate hydrolase protein [Xylaria venustula]|nr:P-loop containing nucleoside triphosphate hydrolase protein [Xylaria venustula]